MTKQHQFKYPIILLQNLIKIQWIGLFIVFCIQGVPNKVYFRTVRNLKCFFINDVICGFILIQQILKFTQLTQKNLLMSSFWDTL